MRRFLLALSLLPFLSTSAAAAEPPRQPALPIVERSIAFHGGEVFRRSVMSLGICSRSGCFDIRARIDGDAFDYVVEGESGGKRRKVHWWNGGVEQWLDGQPVILDEQGRRAAQDFVSARVYFPFLPFRLADASAWKQDLGLEPWGERSLHTVKVTFTAGSSTDAGDEYLYWFDPETGRLEQFAYSFGRGESGGLRFRRGLDYRKVGGVLFFDQENLALDGPGLTVDMVTPTFVAERLKPLSVVQLRDVKVEPLP